MAWRKRAEIAHGLPPVDISTSMTAAGATYRVSSYTDSTRINQQRQPWQYESYKMYDAEGHLYYAANYVGNAMARLRLVPAIRSEIPGEEPTAITSGPLVKAVRNIKSASGGQRGLLRSVGRNVFLAGEAWLVGSEEVLPNGASNQVWDAVSISELKADGNSGGFRRHRLPGSQGEPLPHGALTLRIWKEHPEYTDLADAGTRSAMELLEKIVTLNRAEKAVARSRLAGSGILFVPQELVPVAWQNQTATPNQMESNPIFSALAEGMISPLSDPSHPGSVVPIVFVGPGEAGKNIRYEPMNRQFDAAAANASVGMAVEQAANTLELPKEVLLGTGEATHWTAWAIKEDTFQAHIQPLIELVVDALTQKYLAKVWARMSPEEIKIACEASGVSDPNDIIIWYDASQLVIEPDRAAKADGLHDRLVISDEALRAAHGYPESAKPTDDEKAKRIGLKLADAGMALTGKPTPPPEPGGGAGPGRPPGPQTVNGPRGTTPQGPNSAAPKTAASRRSGPGTPQDSGTR